MNYHWIEEYCLSKKGVVKEFKQEWNVYRYMIGNKMFLMDGFDNNENPILTLKLEPINGEILRKNNCNIIPGYYMNKIHWNSIFKNGKVDDELIKKMIDESYNLIYNSLPKKIRENI